MPQVSNPIKMPNKLKKTILLLNFRYLNVQYPSKKLLKTNVVMEIILK
jgi:hypothetical protein